MLRLRIRNRWRRFAGSTVKAEDKLQGYLGRYPWLGQLVPLGQRLYGVNVEKMDFEALTAHPHQVKKYDMYLLSARGEVLCQTRKVGIFHESVYHALKRYGKRHDADQVRLLANVWWTSWGGNPRTGVYVCVYKIPKDETTTTCVERLMAEKRRAVLDEIRRTGAERMAAFETGAAEAEELFAQD